MPRETVHDDDSGLVERCRSGEDRAFEELVRKYQQPVFNIIYHNTGGRLDVEDIAQRVFTKVYLSLPRFERGRPFFPWLYRIVVNQCYDDLRRAKRRRWRTFSELSLEEGENIERILSQADPGTPAPEERTELHAILLKLLDRLPKQQRLAVVLRDLEDVPYDRMAEIMQCSEQAVRLKVFRARTRLRELMERAIRRQQRPR